jgi:predicted AAA+ superfamily ATPase
MELRGGTPWLDAAFAGRLAHIQPNQAAHGAALLERVLAGGHLESIARDRPRSRHAWQHKQIEALLDSAPKRRLGAKEEKLLMAFSPPPPSDFSELRQYHALDKPHKAIALLRAVAASSGQICNFRQWGASAGIDLDSKTTERYLRGLEWLFLVRRLPSVGADGAGFALSDRLRMVKTDKLHFSDSGLLAELLDENSVHAERARQSFGGVWNPPAAQMLTNFAVSELLAQGAAGVAGYRFAHYRDHDQQDIDLVVCNAQGDTILVYVKAAERLGPPDTRAMGQLAEKLGQRLRLAVILYDGRETQQVMTLPNGAPLWIAPVSSLWGRLG